ncbi:MAG: hypothetical protein JWM47_2063 [Acidimicrobiales bacterium]|nr:hypothetical protein [Acidimicrobiales bacterium]
MEFLTFIIGLIAGVAGTQVYSKVQLNNRSQKARGGDGSVINQAGRDMKDSGN